MPPPQQRGGQAGLLAQYTQAMIAGHTQTCIRIERENDVFGYPPEIVSVALKAIDDGEDPDAALDAYMRGDDEEDHTA